MAGCGACKECVINLNTRHLFEKAGCSYRKANVSQFGSFVCKYKGDECLHDQIPETQTWFGWTLLLRMFPWRPKII